MKKLFAAALLALLANGLASGHGGGLDRNGGHYNRKTGVYHCHRCSTSAAPLQRAAPVERKQMMEGESGQSAGQTDVRVWVNTKSGVYHCSGTRWYGSTKAGEFMSERNAQRGGNRPAYGTPCS